MHKTHPIKTGKYGPKLDQMSMQNNPFRAAYEGGHELNESYKMPVPNSSGQNHSYIRPVAASGGANTQKLNRKQNLPAGPIKLGKNTF